MSKTLTGHIFCNSKCKFDGRICNLNQKRNKKLCLSECKNPIKHHVSGKENIWNPITWACEINKCLKSIIGDSVFTSDEITDVVVKLSGSTSQQTFSRKRQPVK